jgi:hypothetical protein
MRRTLTALAAAAVLAAIAPTHAGASHQCAEGFEILCTNVCLQKQQICLH